MPQSKVRIFEFTSPDGKSYEVQGPEGATVAQAFEILKTHLNGAQKAAAPSEPRGGNQDPYSITTRDGITIQNIPGHISPDAPELRERVAKIREGRTNAPNGINKQGRSGLANVEKPAGRFVLEDEATPAQPGRPRFVLEEELPETVQPLTSTDRFVKGLRDPIDAGAQLLTNALSESVVQAGNRLNNWIADKTGLVGRLPDGGVDQQVREAEQAYQQNRTAAGESGIDGYRIFGNLVSPANLAATRIVPTATTLAGRMAAGAGTGAAFGALTPVGEGNFAEEKTAQVLKGAATGAALPALLGGLARVVSPKASTNPNVALIQKEGVQPTIGQTLGGRMNTVEEKLQSLPIVGDRISIMRNRASEQFNRAAINRAVEPIGGKVDAVGREGVAQAKAALSKAYDDLLPKLRFSADPQFSTDLTRIQSMVASGLPPQEGKTFLNIIQKQLVGKMTPAGRMSGDTFKQVESELSRLAKGYNGDPSFDKRQIGAALNELLSSMRSALERSNPSHAAQLSKINRGYANYARVRDAASRLGAEEGSFTPAQLQSAVRAADKSVGKGRFATGDALMQDLSEAGKTVLSQKVPNSGTADRALLAGGALGSYFINPAIPAALVGGAGIYTAPVQNALRYLVTARPAMANALAEPLRNSYPILTPAMVQALGREQ